MVSKVVLTGAFWLHATFFLAQLAAIGSSGSGSGTLAKTYETAAHSPARSVDDDLV